MPSLDSAAPTPMGQLAPLLPVWCCRLQGQNRREQARVEARVGCRGLCKFDEDDAGLLQVGKYASQWLFVQSLFACLCSYARRR